MNNNIVKEIDIVRELMRDLNNPRYRLLNQAEKALILRALNDYEFSLKTEVLQHNINAKLMKEDGIDAEEIKPETDVFEDLCLDSLGLFGLGAHITDTFKRNVPISSVAELSKIGDLFTLLKEQGVPQDD